MVQVTVVPAGTVSGVGWNEKFWIVTDATDGCAALATGDTLVWGIFVGETLVCGMPVDEAGGVAELTAGVAGTFDRITK